MKRGNMLLLVSIVTAFYSIVVAEVPNWQSCLHDVSNIEFRICNHGLLGYEYSVIPDCITGQMPDAFCIFPAGSDKEYLEYVTLWFGAVVGDDTLCSTGFSLARFGISQIDYHHELNPDVYPGGEIVRISSRLNSEIYSDDANSDLDMIAVYADTHTSSLERSYFDGPHKPLGLKITQRSMTWSAGYVGDFALIDYTIENIGNHELRDIYLGINLSHSPADSVHTHNAGDYCGLIETRASSVTNELTDSLYMAWGASRDGAPGSGGGFDLFSLTSVSAVRVIRSPNGQTVPTYNWWTSDSYWPHFYAFGSWGPMEEGNMRRLSLNSEGFPLTDGEKFYMMTNRERDYDSFRIGKWNEYTDYLPPSSLFYNAVQTGTKLHQLMSYGPFDLLPGDTVPLTIAVICGEDFHRDPTNYQQNIINSYYPDEYYKRLDFDDLIQNAKSAEWVYDNPGYDTDNDGYAGPYIEFIDTLPSGEISIEKYYYAGDGIPDFRAASPPTPPILRLKTYVGKAIIKWNGMVTETSEDPFTHRIDFEGYRLYMGRFRRLDSYALLDSRDVHNYSRYKWDNDRNKWIRTENPFTLDSLEVLYGEDFDPEKYPYKYDPIAYDDGVNLWCFDPMDWNKSITGWNDGSPWKSDLGIHKTYADEIAAGEVTDEIDIEDTLTSNNWIRDIDPQTGDSVWYHKFWEYEYIANDLLPSVAWHFSVTAFDFGDAIYGIDPLETSPLANSIEVWAISDAEAVREDNLPVKVYPNPYHGDGSYALAGYEDPLKTGFIDHERRIHFLNLPTECTITIYTISGDIVRKLKHPGNFTDTESKLTWNVRSTNNEIVTSGIYLYVVESRWGKQMGKIVIIL